MARKGKVRLALGVASAVTADRYRPLMVNLVVTRRCNLSCAYCTEYDHSSAPVPLDVMFERLDHLARLRTLMVSLCGGEPLLHPGHAQIVKAARARHMSASILTNGFLLNKTKIEALNRAGLYAMQVSVDAVKPNAVTRKALHPLQSRLEMLAKFARFRVRVNTVLGSAPAEEALEVVRTVVGLGLEAKCSLRREADGRLAPLDAALREVYETISHIGGRQPWFFDESFQDALLRDGHMDWKCRAGGRFFHVDENGMVGLCTPKMAYPGKLLADYTEDDLRLAFKAPKPCVDHCPVAYAHQLSRVDSHRRQHGAPYPMD